MERNAIHTNFFLYATKKSSQIRRIFAEINCSRSSADISNESFIFTELNQLFVMCENIDTTIEIIHRCIATLNFADHLWLDLFSLYYFFIETNSRLFSRAFRHVSRWLFKFSRLNWPAFFRIIKECDSCETRRSSAIDKLFSRRKF